MAFVVAEFKASFNNSIKQLAKAEKVTRSELMTLSRTLLDALHTDSEIHGDIGYINRTIDVLTPVNKKVAILFFKEFSGFTFDNVEMKFIKKDKKNYDAKSAAAIAFLEDPLNNIWTWAERNVEIEKNFGVDELKKQVANLLQKAEKHNLTKVNVLTAMVDAGVTVQELIEFMGTLSAGVEIKAVA